MIAAFDAGDFVLARELQLKSVKIVNILQPYGGLAAGKALMSYCGVDCGPVRPPLIPLTEIQRSELLKTMEQSGFISEGKINC